MLSIQHCELGHGDPMHDELTRELAAYVGGEGLSPSGLLGLPDGLRRVVQIYVGFRAKP
jgi:hypothetical protein